MPKRLRPYDGLRTAIEQRDGSMIFVRAGYLYGAWLVTVSGKQREFRSDGNGFPELDPLYVPKPGIIKPQHYKDYTQTLVDGAIEKFWDMIG
jgi:hypothetical protein